MKCYVIYALVSDPNKNEKKSFKKAIKEKNRQG